MIPSTQSILDGLRLAANDAIAVALAWHGVTLAAALALLLKWRPSRRMAGALLTAPIASAGVVAFAHNNPFNGLVLGVLALALLGLASRLDAHKVRRAGGAASIVGVAMIAFGWAYPHFLELRPASTYLFAAPAGVVPCATLSLVIGFALLAGGLGSKAWSIALAIAGLFYGWFGFVRLGVRLDIVLVGGASMLLAFALRLRQHLPHHAASAAGAAGGVGDVSSIHAHRRAAPPIP